MAISIKGKKVLIRVDINSALEEGIVIDSPRFLESARTIKIPVSSSSTTTCCGSLSQSSQMVGGRERHDGVFHDITCSGSVRRVFKSLKRMLWQASLL